VPQSKRQLASGRLGALGVDVDGVEGLAGGYEEAITLGAAETEIGARFGKMNFADERAIGREDVDTIEAFAGPSGSGPDVAVGIATNAIG